MKESEQKKVTKLVPQSSHTPLKLRLKTYWNKTTFSLFWDANMVWKSFQRVVATTEKSFLKFHSCVRASVCKLFLYIKPCSNTEESPGDTVYAIGGQDSSHT